MVIDVDLVAAVLLIDNCNAHRFLDRYWHGHFNSVFDGAARYTPLRNDFWDMIDLLYDMLHWLVHNLKYLLRHLPCLIVRNLLD